MSSFSEMRISWAAARSPLRRSGGTTLVFPTENECGPSASWTCGDTTTCKWSWQRGAFTRQANSGPVETSVSCGCLLPLVILLRLTAPELLPLFWRAGGAKGFELCAGYNVLRLNRMVFVSGQLRLQAFGANCRRILIARTLRDERLVGKIYSDFTAFPASANIERVLS